MSYSLHPQLAANTAAVGQLTLCEIRLMNDSQYPWLILVPQVADISEPYQLSESQQQLLQAESSAVGEAIMTLFAGDKLNIGALGNMVPQLHVHHVVRFVGDPAWPRPVWAVKPPVRYADAVLQATLEQLQLKLAELPNFVAA